MRTARSINTAVAAECSQPTVTGDPNMTPVRRLLVAMIAQSADDISMFRASPKVTGQRIYREARNWVLSESAEHPFSFVSICDALAYSPEAVRSAILGGRRRRIVPGAALATPKEELALVDGESLELREELACELAEAAADAPGCEPVRSTEGVAAMRSPTRNDFPSTPAAGWKESGYLAGTAVASRTT